MTTDNERSKYVEHTGPNPIQKTLKLSNIPSVLHVVVAITNPGKCEKKYQLACECLKRLKDTPGVALYVVELVYGDQEFQMTDAKMKRELQMRTDVPLSHKESMVNCAVAKLLPETWKYMAWIDADLEWSDTVNSTPNNWATDALKVLQVCNIVQLFSHAISMDAEGNAEAIHQGLAYQYVNKMKRDDGINLYHPGFAWACTREFYTKMGGLLEISVIECAEQQMASCWIGEKAFTILDERVTEGYKQSVQAFADRCYPHAKLGYVPYTVTHHMHYALHNKVGRFVLDPETMLQHDDQGLIVPTATFPQNLIGVFAAQYSLNNL